MGSTQRQLGAKFEHYAVARLRSTGACELALWVIPEGVSLPLSSRARVS